MHTTKENYKGEEKESEKVRKDKLKLQGCQETTYMMALVKSYLSIITLNFNTPNYPFKRHRMDG